jgi:XTP/dITP diphosphohydrolase
MKPSWVLASNNLHKLQEFRTILEPVAEILSMSDIGCSINPDETGKDFNENALIKALAVSEFTDLPVIADDSGLECDALNGEPGIYSARFAGPGSSDTENTSFLLHRLNGLKDRKARFVCVICYLEKNGVTRFFQGYINGIIAEAPRGTLGFGYDPVFIPEGFNNTFAELGSSIKNSLSHRAIALQELSSHFNNRTPY